MRINFDLSEYSSIKEQYENLKTVNEKIIYLKRIEADVKMDDVIYSNIPDILENLQIDIKYFEEVKALQPEVKTKGAMRLKKETFEALERAREQIPIINEAVTVGDMVYWKIAKEQIPIIDEAVKAARRAGIFEHIEGMRWAGIFEEETNEVKEIPSVAEQNIGDLRKKVFALMEKISPPILERIKKLAGYKNKTDRWLFDNILTNAAGDTLKEPTSLCPYDETIQNYSAYKRYWGILEPIFNDKEKIKDFENNHLLKFIEHEEKGLPQYWDTILAQRLSEVTCDLMYQITEHYKKDCGFPVDKKNIVYLTDGAFKKIENDTLIPFFKQELDKAIKEELANAGLDKGAGIPAIDNITKTEVNEEKSIEEQNKDRMIEVLQNKVVVLRNNAVVLRKNIRLKNRPTRDELFILADECRFKSGKINYSKLGREKLGVSHPTAKQWCDEYGISLEL